MNKSAITVSFLVLLEILITFVFPGDGRATTLVKSYYLDHDQMKIRSNIESERQPKIAVVLSGGGARGLSHIGVFKALEEHGIPVHLVIGSSMGSVIGGLYASGYSPEQIGIIIKEIAWPEIFLDETERSTLFLAQKGEQDRYLISVRFKDFQPYIPNAISPGQKVLTILSELFLKAHFQPRNNFDNLKIPFRAVATDLVSGKRVVLKEGNLAECINGSLAIPLLFSPVAIDSMMLVDGGLLSNVPVDVAEELGADIVIAVDITAQLRPRTEMDAPWEIVDQVTTIMSEPVNRLQKGNADIVIKPALDGYLNTDFSQIDSMIDAGYRAAGVHIGEIARLIQRRKYHSDTTIHFTSLEVPESLRENHRDVYDSLNISMKNVLSLAEISGDLDKILTCGCYAQAAARIEDGDGNPLLILELTPFPDLDSVVFSGNSSLDDKQLRSVLTSKTGKQINAHTLSADLAAITELYRKQGFSLMTIRRSDLDFTSRQVILEIDEGVIDKIRIEGNHNTRDFVIRREFTLREGDVFNWINVNRSIKNIYATELFDRVGVDIIPEGDQTNLVIKVDEKSSIRMRLGGKIDNERRAQSYIEFGDDNLFGAGLRTTLLTRLGQRDGLVSLNMRSDRIFTSYLTFTVQSYYSWTINHIQGNNQSGRYREDRVGLRFQIGQQLRRIGQLGAELRVERAKDEAYSGTFTLDQDLELRTLSLHSITDKRDRIDFPTSGIYNHWIWETGSKLFLKSQESYTKAALNLEGYYTVKTYHTWHIRFMTGVGDETVPFSENYRLGGLHSFFGLLENQYYGQQILQVNGEYRIRLPVHFMEGLYLGGRFDFGGIWEKPELLFDAEDFFTGIGGYLAVDTYLGPLYMGYGYMSDRRTAAYLSLGFNF